MIASKVTVVSARSVKIPEQISSSILQSLRNALEH